MTRKNKINTLFLLFLSALFFFSCGNKLTEKEKRETGKGSIIETGELAAINSLSFVLPRYGMYWYQMRVIGILEHGTIVNPGDSIIQLDPTEVKKFIIDRESNLETEMANMEKLNVDHANRTNDLISNIRNEKASYDLKKIELESSRFEAERLRKIKELEFEQVKITLTKAEKRLELNEIITRNETKIQEIRVRQIKNEIDNAYSILPRLTFRSPISGVFQIGQNYQTRTLVKVGDNIYPGNNMANVPELEWMKVNTYVNETDFLKIKVGQKVSVRLDALSGVVFDGEVSYIGKLCHLRDYNSKSRQKVFDVEVKMLSPDPRLKPGMTVSCEYLEEN